MIPRRSILSIPGHIKKMHQKAAESNVDIPMLDLEDSVPVSEKDNARETVINSINNIDWNHKALSIRINGLDTQFAYKDIIETVKNCKNQINTIVIPKVDTVKDVNFVDILLNELEMELGLASEIGLEISIESALGLENISQIAKSSSRIKTLVFGIADFQASIGAKLVSISGHGENEEEIYPGHRWNYVISKIVTTAKANNIQAIDAAYGNFKDLDGLQRSSQIACSLGCDGKWAIHPGQIEIINKIFTPTDEEIKNAVKIVEAHQNASQTGKGAVNVDGRMVDHATLRMAKELLEKAKYLSLIS